MADGDEIIVSDDGLVDNTTVIVEGYKKIYPNIKIVNGPRKGYSSNFGNALKYACNEIIIFSDPDDVWCDNKVALIKSPFLKMRELQLFYIQCILLKTILMLINKK